MKKPKILFISPRQLNQPFSSISNNDFDNNRVADMILYNHTIKNLPVSLIIYKSSYNNSLKFLSNVKIIELIVKTKKTSGILSWFLKNLGMAVPSFLMSFYSFTFNFFLKIKKQILINDIIVFATSTTFIPIIYSRLKKKLVIVDPFGSFFQLSLRNIYSTSIIMMPIWLIRLILAYLIEFISFHSSNIVLAFNEEHREYLSKTFLLAKSKIYILPIKINKYLPKANKVQKYRLKFNLKKSDYVALFVGNFLIPQNLVPLKQLISKSNNSRPNIKYLIVGLTPKNLSFPPNFITTGFIKDLENIYPLANVSLAPTSQGSGIKTKILLSLLANKAVITTPEGANFLPNNINLSVTSPSKIIENINKMSLSLNKQSAPAGYKYTLNNFTVKPFTKKLDKIFFDSLRLFKQLNF